MKKMLLLSAVLLVVTSAGAQLKSSATAQKPLAQMKEMKMGAPGIPAQPRLNANRDAKPYYIRPAGAFVAAFSYSRNYPVSYSCPTNPYLVCKAYTDYTFRSVSDGVGPDATYTWYNIISDTATTANGRNFTVRYEATTEDNKYYAPALDVEYADSTYVYYIGNTDSETHDKLLAKLLSALNFGSVQTNRELLVSSKTFCWGGRWSDKEYPFTYFHGAEAYGDNARGWWFGKNSGNVNGIAQAFEKPTAPYILRNVALTVTGMKVAEAVQMTCKVYKLNGIPAYDEEMFVTLDDQIGEQIATGIANLNASSTNNELIVFTLYDVNGTQVITPEIDDAILIAIEGYNSAGMSNLTDFSALISTDYEVDEGYGELAYIKTSYDVSTGDYTGEYKWLGLNNFFNGNDGLMTMKTGLSIFMVIDQPYIGFYNSLNPGEYTFPVEGGLMQARYGNTTVERSIRFTPSCPYSADVWSVTNVDGNSVPDWLHIIAIENYGENYGDIVNAMIYADALPEGTLYREVTLRFSIPGAYIDYTFKQGEKLRGDVNDDGSVDITDATMLINYLLSGNASGIDLENANCDLQGGVDISDATTLINYLLNGLW